METTRNVMERVLGASVSEGIVMILENIASYFFGKNEERPCENLKPEIPYLTLDCFESSLGEDSQRSLILKTDSPSNNDKKARVRVPPSSPVSSFIPFEMMTVSNKDVQGKYSSSPISSFIRFENDTLSTIHGVDNSEDKTNLSNDEIVREILPSTSFMWSRKVNVKTNEVVSSQNWKMTPRSDEFRAHDETFLVQLDSGRYTYSDGETVSSSQESANVENHDVEELPEEVGVTTRHSARKSLEMCVQLNKSFFFRRNAIHKKLMKYKTCY